MAASQQVILELKYGWEVTYPMVFVPGNQVPMNGEEIDYDQLLEVAVARFRQVTGAAQPTVAFLNETNDYYGNEDGDEETFSSENVSIHWAIGDLNGLDAKVFQQAVTEFGNMLIKEGK